MHYADGAWRFYRRENGEDLAKYENAVAGYQSHLLQNARPEDLQRLKKAFEQIPMPGGVPYNLSGSEVITEPWRYQGAAFFSAYRQTKRIYKVDRNLWDALVISKWPGKCPIEAFHLPVNGMVLEIETDGETPLVFGLYYDHSTGREATGHLEIRILNIAYPPGPGAVFDLANAKTIDDAWEGVMAKIFAKFPLSDRNLSDVRQAWKNEVRGCINTVLYILGNEDVVREVHPGGKKTKIYQDPEKKRRAEDLKDPDVHHVGKTYASALERWEETQESSRGDGRGPSKRPHVRAAHSHLYWTGEGRKTPVVKFLAPIQVHGGNEDGSNIRIK